MNSIAEPPVRYAIAKSTGNSEIDGINPNMTLWRYIDLSKLVSLIDSSALYFTRSDILGDPFEGSITTHRLELRQKEEENWKRTKRPKMLTANSKDLVETAIKNTIINCWHMNENESTAMWKLYLKSDEGVAIRSSFSRLLSSIPENHDTEQQPSVEGWKSTLYVRAIAVKYIDYNKEKTGLSTPFLFKRLTFAHEQEMRLIIQDDSMQGDPRPSRFPKGGDYVPIDVSRLIESIYISPYAPEWFTGVVQSIITKYGFGFPVHKSTLSDSPIH